MAQITETNQQYYQGAQGFRGTGNALTIVTTFNTDLVYGNWNPTIAEYALNNFKIYTSTTGFPGSWSEYLLQYSVVNNSITFAANPANNLFIVVQLKKLDGGQYGNTPTEEAIGDTVEENYGTYQYIKLGDIIDNYMVGYVGDGKILQSAKKSDVLFFAKRSLQEFSYDTLKSIRSQELTLSPSATAIIPQDYVNYVRMSWVDGLGIKHIIYPTQLTSNPDQPLLQDSDGIPTQDNFGENLESMQAIINQRWKRNSDYNQNGLLTAQSYNANIYNWTWWEAAYGMRYGANPVISNMNGWFTINDREGKFMFSSNLKDQLIILEYISDGLAYDMDSKVPKMAEEAMYMHIAYNILAGRANVQEYVVRRYKVARRAELRNAKIRLQNIKLDTFVQQMRGKSKWIKH